MPGAEGVEEGTVGRVNVPSVRHAASRAGYSSLSHPAHDMNAAHTTRYPSYWYRPSAIQQYRESSSRHILHYDDCTRHHTHRTHHSAPVPVPAPAPAPASAFALVPAESGRRSHSRPRLVVEEGVALHRHRHTRSLHNPFHDVRRFAR